MTEFNSQVLVLNGKQLRMSRSLKRFFTNLRLIKATMLCCCMAISFGLSSQIVNAKIYMSNGSVVMLEDSLGIDLPHKDKSLVVYENVYTARQKTKEKLAPESIDSIVAWSRTSPNRKHTLVFLRKYGWSWLYGRGEYINIYLFTKKGYSIFGNGGMCANGNEDVIVEKGESTYVFKQAFDNSDDKFKREVVEIVADDPSLVEMILQSPYIRRKTLKMLSRYSPQK